MEDFIDSLENEYQKTKLLNAIQGKGAYKQFNTLSSQFDIRESWYKFQEQAYASIARDWCLEHDLKFES